LWQTALEWRFLQSPHAAISKWRRLYLTPKVRILLRPKAERSVKTPADSWPWNLLGNRVDSRVESATRVHHRLRIGQVFGIMFSSIVHSDSHKKVGSSSYKSLTTVEWNYVLFASVPIACQNANTMQLFRARSLTHTCHPSTQSAIFLPTCCNQNCSSPTSH
jgi:hypothetical protein